MKRLIRFLHLLKIDEKGNVLIIVAAALIVLMGMTALVVDVGQLYSARRQMVNAADGAALAGALEAKNNEKFARETAEKYALFNGANDIFDKNLDVYFTGDDEFRIISVRVLSNEVEYTFARVLGFDSTIVPAIASAQVGPGNPLVPFVDLGWECDQCNGTGQVCACDACGNLCEGESCGGKCVIVDCPGTCSIQECDKCGGLGYYVRGEEDPEDPYGYGPAESGDYYELKYERWQDWLGATSGDFPYIRLPGQTGAQDLYENLAGGYTGDLEDVVIGKILPAQTGNIAGKLREAMLTRMTIHGEPYCSYEDINKNHGDWYKCDLVVVIPIVIKADTGPKDFEVVGYASLLLDGNNYDGEKNVWAWFLEYLTYEKLQNLLTENLEGFVVRLVQDPEEALNFFKSSR